MKVKRFKAILHADEILANPSTETYNWSGNVVLATDYDALLALARKLRGALIFDYGREPIADGTISQTCQCAKCVALRDSAWLEE